MIQIMKLLCLLSMFSAGLCSRHLPDYVKACPKNNQVECPTKSAQLAFVEIIKGDKSIKLPNFLPYHIEKIEIETAGNLKLVFSNNVFYGIETFIITHVEFDLQKQTIKGIAHAPKLMLISNYAMDGKILVLPITGNGQSNMTYINTVFDFDYNFDKYKKDDGNEYIKCKELKVVFEPEVVYYHFENLFNGDKRLGDEMNKFLNDNHKEVGNDLNPELAKVVSAVVANTMDIITGDVPYDEIFL